MSSEVETESGVKVPHGQINYNTVGASAGIASFLGLNAGGLFGSGWGASGSGSRRDGGGRMFNDFEHDFVTETELSSVKEAGDLKSQISKLESEKYTDTNIIAAYKDAVERSNAADAKIQAVVKDVTASFIEHTKNAAVMETKIECMQERMNNMKENIDARISYENKALQDKIDNIGAALNGKIDSGFYTVNQKIDYENKALDNKINAGENAIYAAIKCAKNEAIGAIALESERRECGDKNLYNYVNGTFIPGKLYLPAENVTPEPMRRYNFWQAPTEPAQSNTK